MTRLNMIKALPPGTTGMEIGVCEGVFSRQILSTPVKMLIMVDCWEHQPTGYEDPANVDQGGHDDRYHRVMAEFDHLLRATVVKAYSCTDVVKRVMKQMSPIDWVYIDASHNYQAVLNDLKFYSEYAPVLFCHDFCDNNLGFKVKEAVEGFLSMYPDWKIECVTDEEWPTVKLVNNAA